MFIRSSLSDIISIIEINKLSIGMGKTGRIQQIKIYFNKKISTKIIVYKKIIKGVFYKNLKFKLL